MSKPETPRTVAAERGVRPIMARIKPPNVKVSG